MQETTSIQLLSDQLASFPTTKMKLSTKLEPISDPIPENNQLAIKKVLQFNKVQFVDDIPESKTKWKDEDIKEEESDEKQKKQFKKKKNKKQIYEITLDKKDDIKEIIKERNKNNGQPEKQKQSQEREIQKDENGDVEERKKEKKLKQQSQLNEVKQGQTNLKKRTPKIIKSVDFKEDFGKSLHEPQSEQNNQDKIRKKSTKKSHRIDQQRNNQKGKGSFKNIPSDDENEEQSPDLEQVDIRDYEISWSLKTFLKDKRIRIQEKILFLLTSAMILVDIAFSIYLFNQFLSCNCFGYETEVHFTDYFNIIISILLKLCCMNIIMQEITNTLPGGVKLPFLVPTLIMGLAPNLQVNQLVYSCYSCNSINPLIDYKIARKITRAQCYAICSIVGLSCIFALICKSLVSRSTWKIIKNFVFYFLIGSSLLSMIFFFILCSIMELNKEAVPSLIVDCSIFGFFFLLCVFYSCKKLLFKIDPFPFIPETIQQKDKGTSLYTQNEEEVRLDSNVLNTIQQRDLIYNYNNGIRSAKLLKEEDIIILQPKSSPVNSETYSNKDKISFSKINISKQQRDQVFDSIDFEDSQKINVRERKNTFPSINRINDGSQRKILTPTSESVIKFFDSDTLLESIVDTASNASVSIKKSKFSISKKRRLVEKSNPDAVIEENITNNFENQILPTDPQNYRQAQNSLIQVPTIMEATNPSVVDNKSKDLELFSLSNPKKNNDVIV